MTLEQAYSNIAKEDKNAWKYPWLKEVCQLCLEYMMLDGLQDALRASDIPDEILDIVEQAINKKGGINESISNI